MSDLQEFFTGTDPTNSVSAFRISSIALQGEDILITWTMGSDKTNALHAVTSTGYTNDIAEVFTVTNTVGAATNYLDVGAVTNVPSRLYRVRFVP